MKMRGLVVTLCALLPALLPLCASAQIAGPVAELQLQLASISLHAPGHVAMEIKDLGSGAISSVNARASMPAASTIKIPVMVEVFRQLSNGRFDFNTTVGLRRSDKDWGSGSLCNARAGTRYSVLRLLKAMITVSDNTATNMLIRLVGRQNINDDMLSIGLQHTRLSDYIRSQGDDIRYALRSSPADMVMLLEQMAGNELIDRWSSREMISILEGQRHNGLLPEPLPMGLPIAHKTGTLHDTLNDVGIVFADPQPYVIAVMTTNLPSLSAGRRFIRGVSRLAYDQIEQLAGEAPVKAPAPSDDTGSDTPMWDTSAPAAQPAAQPAPTATP